MSSDHGNLEFPFFSSVFRLYIINLTVSIIPFVIDRDWPVDKLKDVKVADALKHPNWNMGKKITVDSATLFNKVYFFLMTSV